MKNQGGDHEAAERAAERRYAQRDKRKGRQMKVSGSGVKKLARIIKSE